MNTKHPHLKRIIQLFLIAFFLAMLSPFLVMEALHRTGSTILNIRPYPVFYSNVLGNLKPDFKATTYWNPETVYTYSTTDKGFRSNGKNRENPEAAILCLGDSYTFGVGVPDGITYPAKLERTLNDPPGSTRVSVYNAGTLGTGLNSQARHYIDKLQDIPHDIVIEQFYYFSLGHTYTKPEYINKKSPNAKIYSAKDDSLLCGPILAYFTDKLKESPVTQWLYAQVSPGGQGSPGTAGHDTPFSPPFVVTDAMQTILGSQNALLDERKSSQIQPVWDAYLAQLLELKTHVESSGKEFLFIIIPDMSQLEAYRNAPSAILSEFCDKHGIKYIDFTQTFRSLYVDKGISPYLKHDFHCNELSSAIIASEISKRIIQVAQPPRARLRLTGNPHKIRRYSNPRTVALRMDGQGKLSLPENDFITLTQASYGNPTARREFGGDMRLLKTDTDVASISSIRLAFKTKTPFSQVSAVFVPHMEGRDNILNKLDVVLSYGGTETGFSTAQLADPWRYIGYDARAFLEGAPVEPPTSTFEFTINMLRDAGICYGDNDGDERSRRIELYVYEAETGG